MSSHDSSTDPALLERGATTELSGRRILVVEDSPVVGPFTADLLAELGCEVIGPAPTMAAARELIERGGYDAALMDIHIRGERVFPLCETIEARGVPFVLTTGYADWQMPDKWDDRPRLQKPYTLRQVEDALKACLVDRSGSDGEADGDAGAGIPGALDVERAAVPLDDMLDDREAEAGAA
jgi:CheY-like chemotaxis protein